jgi:hypothetical protein
MNGIKITQRSITPQEATRLLEGNKGNRRLSENNVMFFKQQMLKGEWQLTGDPIKIGKDGRLLDGQHRLEALVKYGKPVEMFVAEGLDNKVFTVIDTGKSRSASDVLSTQGFKNSPALSGTVKYILLFNKGHFGNQGSAAGSTRVTNGEVLNFVDKNPTLLEVVNYSAGIYRQFRYIAVTSLGMLYWQLSKKNQTKCDIFFERYATGIDLSESSPIRLLRERLIRDGQNKTKLSNRDKVALFIMAWNAFLSGKRVQQLTLQKNYKFPKPL